MPTDNQNLPLIALIGPTNAGKSTLFNRLTGSWQAVTAKEESTTRDRLYGEVAWQGGIYTIIDTGGLTEDQSELYQSIQEQTNEALAEADLVLFIYDAKVGLEERDRLYLDKLRGVKKLWLIANKVDNTAREQRISKLDNLGLPFFEISAATGRGVADLLDHVTTTLPKIETVPSAEPVIAIIGRPNVGKSTLLNALTDSSRSVVSPIAGTTRDVVTEKLALGETEYLLADTAGVRRRGRIEQGPEAFSVKRALRAVNQATAVLVVLDASEGTTRGDMHLAYLARDLGKPVLLVFNKCDLLEEMATQFAKHLQKFDHVAVSAKDGVNLEQVSEWISTNARSK